MNSTPREVRSTGAFLHKGVLEHIVLHNYSKGNSPGIISTAIYTGFYITASGWGIFMNYSNLFRRFAANQLLVGTLLLGSAELLQQV